MRERSRHAGTAVNFGDVHNLWGLVAVSVVAVAQLTGMRATDCENVYGTPELHRANLELHLRVSD